MNRYGNINFAIVSHWRALKTSIRTLKQKPLAYFVTTITMGIIITLPAVLYLLLHQFQSITQQWSNKPNISIYLKQTTSSEQVNIMIEKIRQDPSVLSATYIDPDQGLKELNQYIAVSNVSALLENNPLPAVINVTFAKLKQGTQSIDTLLSALKKSPLIDQVSIDVVWIQRLQNVVSIAKRIMLVLAILLCSAVILVISNTVRLTTQTHQHETQILTLIGATRSYIRRPFLYHGLLYGFLGGLLAWGLSKLALYWVTPPLRELIQSYQQVNPSPSNGWVVGVLIVVLTVLLSISGSWLAIRRQLGTQSM